MLNLFGKSKEKKETTPIQQQENPKAYFAEISTADSSYYAKYQLKPYNPSALFQKKGGYDIYDEMREDDQVGAILNLKKYLILNAGYDIECEDENVKEFLLYCLTDGLDEIFIKKLYDILSAIDYGFSLTEKIFAPLETEKFGTKIILQKLKTRAPHSFEIHTDNFGNVSKILQHASKGDIDIAYNKFIHYSYRREFDNPYGNSDLNLGVYRAWWSKNAVIKFWNIYLERYSSPVVIGKYPQNQISAKEDFLKILRDIQIKTAFAIPDNFIVELLQANAKGNTDYESAIAKYNLMISRAMLIPDLLGFGGSEISGGSYALGKEHFNIFYNIIQFIREELSRIINRDIINPLVLWNFGNSYEAKFKFNSIDKQQKTEDMKTLIEVWKTGKIPANYQLTNWILQGINAPELTEEEWQEEQDKKDAMATQGGIPGQEGKQNGNKEDIKKGNTNPDKINKTKEVEKKELLKEKKEEMTKQFSQYYRELTIYEKKVDFENVSRETENIEKKYIEELAKAFKLSINALIDEIKRRRIIERKRIDLVNGLELKNMINITKIIKDMLKDSYIFGRQEAKKEINKKEFIIDNIAELTNEEVILWLREHAIYTATVEAAEILKKVKPIIFESIRNGAGIKETISMIDEVLKGYDIILDANRIETIARTVIAKAFNEARGQEFQELGDEIVAYQFSAIIDGRESDICFALDGKIFPPNKFDYYNPPVLYNCRSLLVTILKDEPFPGFDEMPATERMNGGFLRLI